MPSERQRGSLGGYDRASAQGTENYRYIDYVDFQADIWGGDVSGPPPRDPTEPIPTNVEMMDAWRTSAAAQEIANAIHYRICLSHLRKDEDMPLNVSDYQGGNFMKAEHLNGEARLFKIDRVEGQTIKNNDTGKTDDKLVVFFVEQERSLVLNVINMNTIKTICGNLGDAEKWAGFHVVLYPTETEFGGKMVPCIRVRPPKGGANDANESLLKEMSEAGTGQAAKPDADIPF